MWHKYWCGNGTQDLPLPPSTLFLSVLLLFFLLLPLFFSHPLSLISSLTSTLLNQTFHSSISFYCSAFHFCFTLQFIEIQNRDALTARMFETNRTQIWMERLVWNFSGHVTGLSVFEDWVKPVHKKYWGERDNSPLLETDYCVPLSVIEW